MTNTTRPLALLMLTLPLLVPACGVFGRSPIGLELRESGRFDSEWRRYLQLPPHKSLAFAGEVEGRYVIGYGFDEISGHAAEYAALKDCEIRRVDKRIESECRTVAIDDEFIDEDGDLLGSIRAD
jgi:hypothetical protein